MSRSKASGEKFKEKLEKSGCAMDREWMVTVIDPEDDGEETGKKRFRECQLIHTVTCSREPILGLEHIFYPRDDEYVKQVPNTVDPWKTRPLHITACGADSIGKQELDAELVNYAATLICDSIDQSAERGEFQHLVKKHPEMKQSRLIELGEIFDNGGYKPWGNVNEAKKDETTGELKRVWPNKSFTIFDTSGIAAQDVVIAKVVCQTLEKQQLEMLKQESKEVDDVVKQQTEPTTALPEQLAAA